MKLEEISFDDEAFKAVVFATGETEAEAVTQIRARKQKIQSTKGIEHFPNLKVLDLTRNKLSSIDLSGNTKLEQLFLGNNQLETLDVSMLPQLEGLEVFMNDIEVLDLSHNPKLEVLYANANDFSKLDLTGNSLLEDVQLSDNQLSDILLPDSLSPERFSAQNNLFSDDQKELLRKSLEGVSIKL